MYVHTPDGEPGGPPWRRVLGGMLLSLLVGVALFFAVIPLAAIPLEATIMGKHYEEMSLDPLGGHGLHPERFLSPLLAWLLGLSGSRYWLFSHGLVVLFLALVHHLALTRTRDHLWAVTFAAGVAVSGAVEVYRCLVGYTEPATFCMLCLAILFLQRPSVFWLLAGLNLLNHGQTIFLWPWLVYERSRVARLGRVDVLLAAAGLAVYLFARSQLLANTGTPTLTASFYLRNLDWFRALEMWVLLVPNIVFCFGPFLIVLLWDLVGNRRREALPAMLCMLAGVCGVLVLALDIFRFAGLFVFPMIVAAHRRLVPDRRSLVVLIAAIVLTIALLPLQRETVMYLLRHLAESQLQGLPHPTLQGLVPACWPAFVGYALFVVILTVVAYFTLPQGNRSPRRQLQADPGS